MNNLEIAERKVIATWPWISFVYTIAFFTPWCLFINIGKWTSIVLGASVGFASWVLITYILLRTTPQDAFGILISIPFFSDIRSDKNRLISAVVWFLQYGYAIFSLASLCVFICLFIAGLFGWKPPLW